jgi:short subunit dehydrogenase-like uncharacterized protein
MPSPLVIYGAYGYTGELVARRAVERGLSPILAGRDSERLALLARELDCEWRAFPLSVPEALRHGIEGAAAVLHCAGPFSRTFRPMAEACLDARVHYLDITGEIPVLEGIAKMGAHAERAGVMLLPGAGFDVVPSDCLAAHLVRRLPEARSIVLAFQGLGRLSRGTARTMMASSGEARGAVVVPGTRTFDMGHGPVTGVSVPWGDLVTAPRSTGVDDVTVYMITPTARRLLVRAAPHAAPLLRVPFVAEVGAYLLTGGERGPDATARNAGRSVLYGEATGGGRTVATRLRGPDGYRLTADAAVEIAARVLRGEVVPGWQTPASAYGPDLVLALPGITRADLA